MSNVSDKSFTYRSYPKLAYGSIYLCLPLVMPQPGVNISTGSETRLLHNRFKVKKILSWIREKCMWYLPDGLISGQIA